MEYVGIKKSNETRLKGGKMQDSREGGNETKNDKNLEGLKRLE